MIRKTTLSIALVLIAVSLAAAEVLRNSDILRMVKAGLSPATIEAKIKSSETEFKVDTDSLIILSDSKVPDSVIRAMIAREEGKSARGSERRPAPRRQRSDSYIPTREFDIYLETNNWNTCNGTLTIDERGMRGTGCASRNLNFDVKWEEIRSFCYEFAFYQTMYIKTDKRRFRVSGNDGRSVAEVQEMLRRYRDEIPELSKCE